MRRNVSRLVLLSLLLGNSAFHLSAQSLLVQVNQQSTGEPISGAFVSLFTEPGELVRSALTNEEGRYLFLPGAVGMFTVRAEMIGHATTERSGIELQAGVSSSLTLDLPISAIRLEGIEIRAEERCRIRPEVATATARVWEEARKALEVQSWAEDQQVLEFELDRYVRELDPQYLRVRSEERESIQAVSRNPLQSLPPEVLARDGFIQEVEGGVYDYFGPDSEVLLSDAFLDTHCLRVTASAERPESVGLAFEPVSGDGTPDIRGTFWLDSESFVLESLDYEYTWSPWDEARERAEGRVEFEALPTGAWIVRRWWIRMPMVGRQHTIQRLGGTGIGVLGIREVGGEVTSISTLDHLRIVEAEWGALAGSVWDSTRAAPLVEAEVLLDGTSYRTRSDSAGHFEIDQLPKGQYSVNFAHPRLDTLNVSLQSGEVEIHRGARTEVAMVIPSRETLASALCQLDHPTTSGESLAGRVSLNTTGDPLPGASVLLTWEPPGGRDPTQIAAADSATFVLDGRLAMEVGTDREGWYSACGVPNDVPVQVVAQFMGRGADTTEVQIQPGAASRMDFDLALPPSLIATVTEVEEVTSGEGIQGVQGGIRDRETGDPIPNVEVALSDLGGRIVARGSTNQLGAFRLLTGVPGTYSLMATALGYADLRHDSVAVGPEYLSVLEMELVPQALELEPIVVTADPRAFRLEMQGFYERKELGLHTGLFFPPDEIEARRPSKVSDLFWGLLGTNVIVTQGGDYGVYFRGGRRPGEVGPDAPQVCWPMIYLDRQLIRPGGFDEPAQINEVVPAFDLAAMEIYRSPAEIPPEFNGANGGCGVIVLWTRGGGME